MTTPIIIIYLVLDFIVIAIVLIYFVLHFMYKKFRLPPGSLIAWQLVGLGVYFAMGIVEDLTIVSG